MLRGVHEGFRISRRLLALLAALLSPIAFSEGPVPGLPSDYRQDIQPILNRRCVVCHGCYDAPCQLKLDVWEGLERGATRARVYDGGRLREAPLTRLEDADTRQQWRNKGFHPVMPRIGDETSQSLLASMLRLKQQHPLPGGDLLPGSFDLSLDKAHDCPDDVTFSEFARDKPLWGMPYALPGLPPVEQKMLLDWLARGAPGRPESAAPSRYAAAIEQWEQFLNQPDIKAQLMSRYIYEHLFHAHLHFNAIDGEASDRSFFRLVRSATAPGSAPAPIATRRPYDDPGVAQVYYRLIPSHGIPLSKTLLPYALNDERMQRWQTLFLEPDYNVPSLPGYAAETSANPFVTFQAMPVDSRYRFMLDEAGFTIAGFIKGPVCRGQVALDVIDDYSWVFFMKPDLPGIPDEARFLADQSQNLRLPAESDAGLFSWREYAKDEANYIKAKRREIAKITALEPPSLDYIWDGGHSPDASLTVYRHFDSATAVRGLLGQRPQTAWLIDYPTLERIHYLLVAGFDVYGDAGHQLASRIYMDFLRMESEFNFLMLLPPDSRRRVHAHWYRDTHKHVVEFLADIEDSVFKGEGYGAPPPAIDYRTNTPLTELYDLLLEQFASPQPTRYQLQNADAPADVTARLGVVSVLRGPQLALFPEISFLRVDGSKGERWYYTLLHHSAFSNISAIFGEQGRRLPEEDRLQMVSGLLGAYPNQFLRIEIDQVGAFVEELAAVRSEADYRRLLDRYGIRRTSDSFWQYSDHLLEDQQKMQPLDGGLFDYSRLENR